MLGRRRGEEKEGTRNGRGSFVSGDGWEMGEMERLKRLTCRLVTMRPALDEEKGSVVLRCGDGRCNMGYGGKGAL